MMEESDVLESNLEYLSLSRPRQVLYRIGHFFIGIPKGIAHFFSRVPKKAKKTAHSISKIGVNLFEAFTRGDFKTRLSFLIMGFGLLTRHQIIRGILYLAYEVFFILFLATVGIFSLQSLPSLGQLSSAEIDLFDPVLGQGITTYHYSDNSFMILLNSILTILLILLMVFLWYNQVLDAYKLQKKSYIGIMASDKETLANVFDKHYDRTLLFLPISGLVLFTVIPIIMMILVSFTNFNASRFSSTTFFDWVGWENYRKVFSTSDPISGGNFLAVLGQVILWTLLWAFFSTFFNYFLGLLLAMLINLKGIKLKKLWRSILILALAVPPFISLLLLSRMFDNQGVVNGLLQRWGWINSPILWLSDAWLSKAMTIILNGFVGIPYTMLLCTGLWMNIPADLYEAARMEGASLSQMHFKITWPYLSFITGPYLLFQFLGNINNFNAIYFLSGGNPAFELNQGVPAEIVSSGLGKTDTLITWLYKMIITSEEKNYGTVAALGLLIFALLAFFVLITNNHASNRQDEEVSQ